MIFRKFVRLCEAEDGEHIINFAEEVVAYRQLVEQDIIGIFNHTYIEVNKFDKAEDVIKKYHDTQINRLD